MATEDTSRRIHECAREKLGLDEFRPGQEEAIRALLEGRDTLAVLPTGSGKSAIYKIAGELIPGPTIVISPLIALQKDQVESIDNEGVGDAAQVNSSQPAGRSEEALEKAKDGDVEFLLLSPEQFHHPETLEALKAAKPSLFVVDEAHCISEWGHDFRPDYLRLGPVIEALGHPTVLALTASAAPPARDEIVERLGMRNVKRIVTGFDRPNIWLGARHFHDEDAKRHALLDAVAATEKPGLVYVATRRHAESLASELSERGMKANAYHAGMRMPDREAVQQAFMGGETEVVVATNAFGMGIDKSDVRFVFHYDIPAAMDAYYQEIGRAGRDFRDAMALLFYRHQDLAVHKFQALSGQVKPEQIERVEGALIEQGEPVPTNDLQEEADVSSTRLNAAISRLEEVGALEMLPTGEVAATAAPEELGDIVEQAAQAQEERREQMEWRLSQMQGYAETVECRRKVLLGYFGEELETPCGFCDNCNAPSPLRQDVGGPFPLNAEVRHRAWGEGRVLRYEENRVVVEFPEQGEKTLDLDVVEEEGLLEPV